MYGWRVKNDGKKVGNWPVYIVFADGKSTEFGLFWGEVVEVFEVFEAGETKSDGLLR